MPSTVRSSPYACCHVEQGFGFSRTESTGNRGVKHPKFSPKVDIHLEQTTPLQTRSQNYLPPWHTAVSKLQPTVLQQGDQSASVQDLQHALQALSLYSGPIDGFFGTQTKHAVRMLQQILAIAITGLFDHTTWCALMIWAKL